jgi:transcriptional regulator with XRE-family HTH domain
MPEFNERVLDYLRENGLTQTDLAGRMRRSPQYVSQILSDKKSATPRTVKLVADALGQLPELLDTRYALNKRRRNATLTGMLGIEIAYLGGTMQALRRARRVLLEKSPGYAMTRAAGKADTYLFDALVENIIIQELAAFNDRCAIFTEEKMAPLGDRRHADVVAYFVDPFDRSKVFSRALERGAKAGKKTIAELVGDQEVLQMEYVDAPFGSITCVRDSQILFNAMIDYASGEIYVACSGMIKHGNIDDCPDPITLAADGQDIVFDSDRQGDSCVCFIGTADEQDSASREKVNQYTALFQDFNFRLDQLSADSAKRSPGGPARILRLADEAEGAQDTRPAFIFANGERICEWIGWLAFALHSKDLAVFELSLEKFWARDKILLAPPPSYSLFAQTSSASAGLAGGPDGPFRLNLERLIQLQNPDKYRGAIAVAHVGSAVVSELRARQNCRELLPHRLFA